jgi:pterin-4a-carbinolamine dehydratase
LLTDSTDSTDSTGSHGIGGVTERDKTEQHPRIFFSYRRTNLLLVDRLHEKFSAAFKPGAIFLDRQDIGPGAVFPDRIRQAVDHAAVVLAIIDPAWISVQDERTLRRRLELEDDWVRQELERALAKGTTIIPVLVNGVNILREEQLPPTSRPLGHIQSVRLGNETFGADAAGLVEDVRRLLIEHRAGEPPGQVNKYPRPPPILPRPLSETALEQVLTELKQWELVRSLLDDDSRFGAGYQKEELKREFRFDSFLEAIEFIRQAASKIDIIDHHPRWENVFKTVTVHYTSFDIGHRLSDRDYSSARMMERCYREFLAAKT